MGMPFQSRLMVVGFILVCFLLSGIGFALAGPVPDEWYASLAKPPFTPPAGAFGPVWFVLYVMMGVSAWLLWLKRDQAPTTLPMALWFAQLLLNAAWTPLFFGLHSLTLATADAVVLVFAIVATSRAFFKVSVPAGWLMLPYLAWTAFATVLTLAIFTLNYQN